MNEKTTLTESEAIQIQSDLRKKVITTDEFDLPIKIIAGVDVEYDKETDLVAGAIVLLDADSHTILETFYAYYDLDFSIYFRFIFFPRNAGHH